MAQAQQERGGGAGAECTSAKDLLNSVTNELNQFEAKKLAELKKDLEAFVQKQKDLGADYEKQYPTIRQTWCDQQLEIETLLASLKCAIPDWKEIAEECICKPKHVVRCKDQAIAKRKRCCQGARERIRDKAQARFDDAKKRLDALLANAQSIKAKLDENAKWIKEITGLLTGPEKAVAVYLFWFKLLPSHVSLTPADCKTVGGDEKPEDLCKTEWDKKCEAEPEPCAPGGEEPPEAARPTRRPAPWLVAPDKYDDELDCAWIDRRDAKDAFAKAESDYKNKPDDLKSLEEDLAKYNKSLEDEIKTCLKGKKPNDPCCKDTDTTQREA